LMKDWFEMEVITASALDSSIATVSFIMESTFNDISSSGGLKKNPKQGQTTKSVLLVLCTRLPQSYPPIVHDCYDIIYLQQP
jgi:hypothetical protein